MATPFVLVHWDRDEAAALARALTERGYPTRPVHDVAALDLKGLHASAPPAVLISLRRLPSHGREVADALWSTRWGRAIPLVFFDGAAAKVEVTRKKFPAARYCRFEDLPAVLKDLAPPGA